MSRLKLISKYFLQNALEQNFSSKKGSSLRTCIVLIIAMLCISMPFVELVNGSYSALKEVGKEQVLINMFIVMGSTFTFMFGINNVLNIFYFSKDIELILPLPFKSTEIIFGKFLSLLVTMYIYSVIIVLPLGAYGVVSKASLVFYLYILIAFLLNPIIPLIIASLISMILMRFTNLSKHKDAFRTVTGVILLIVVIGFSYFNQNSNSHMLSDNIMLGNTSSFLDLINNILISNKFLSNGLLNNSSLNGALFVILAVVINLALFGVYYIIGGNLYYKGIVGITETYSKRENVFESKKINKSIKKNSKIKALVEKDIRVVFRTPKFFINCVAMLFYMPIILGIAFLNSSGTELIKQVATDVSLYSYVIIGAFLFSGFAISSGGASMTAVSREGKDLTISKFIPIDIKSQVKAKIISSILVNEVVALIILLVMIIFKMPINLIILSTIVSTVVIIAVSIVQLWMDFSNPKLNWDSEADIFKKNFMSLVFIVIFMVLSVALFALTSVINNYIYLSIILMIIGVVVSVIFYNMLGSVAYKVLQRD